MKNIIVYQEPGRFGGWPANNGIWSWGDEILVGFERAYYQANEHGHSVVPNRPNEQGLARSLDGGETWQLQDPGLLAGGIQNAAACPGGIYFEHPDFAMKCSGNAFFISYDRGHAWQGPYLLPDFGRRLTARTDYIIQGPESCLFFLSAFEPSVQAGIKDRAFCAQTTDGGKTFEFLGWMTGNNPPSDPIAVRSVMPSTFRGSQGQLISALRRRYDSHQGDQISPSCWIDVYHSFDSGRSWTFLSKVAGTGGWNGNPPSLTRLQDGRLCAAYGCREAPFGMRARLTADDGCTWGEEIFLRGDGRTWDLGYPRMVQRQDGQLVTIYYFTTSENPEQHIAATIWDANQLD